MKPVSLEFCGINSFSEPAAIDFTKLLEFGIFGIFGDTGSGKSTILDCIAFALYGNVSRARGSIADILHYAKDKAYVTFEFEIVFEGARRTYRVERELKRKNAAQSLKVYEKKGDSLLVLADGVRDGNALLERIIGLEQHDFEKCIALPQGEFAQFVKSARADRLRLVSRLFNLEAYGDALLRRAGAKLNQAREDLRVAQAKLEQYADLSAESVSSLRKRAEELRKEDAALREELLSLREQEKVLAIRVGMRAEQEKLSARMEQLKQQKEEMRTLAEELDRLDRASAAVRDAKEVRQCQQRLNACNRNLNTARGAEQEAQNALDEAMLWNAADAEAQEQALADSLAQAKNAAFRAGEIENAQKKLRTVEAKLAAERAAFPDFSYDEELARLDEALARLGSEDFLSYAEQNGKAALLHAEYAGFSAELEHLTKKHPVIEPDSRPLIEKYRHLSEGGTTDFVRLREQFEQEKQTREKLHNQRVALEKRKGRYDQHLSDLQSLSQERQETAERLRSLTEDFTPPQVPAEQLEAQLAALRREKKRRMQEREAAQKRVSDAKTALAAAEAQTKAAGEALAGADARLSRSLQAGGFSGAEDAAALCARYGDPTRARTRVEAYKNEYAAAHSRLNELAKENLFDATQEAYDAWKAHRAEREARAADCARELALAQSDLSRSEENLQRKEELTKECSGLERTFTRFERLRKLLEGNKFMEFIAEEYLETVAENASARLLSLTDGRYFLRYEGGFFVGDNFDGGEKRNVNTLSGGETFLVSLSLALALSAEICARSLRPIEFFFLDEGFGTLDEHLVDVVMDSLERLKNEHFSIGIISHVEELKHRIERKLLVKKATERHGSQIEMV